MTSPNEISETVKAVGALAKEVPIYQDAVQPAAKEVGKALQTAAKTINVALAPLSALIWGFDQIKEFTESAVARRLHKLPSEQIVTPNPTIAGPALEALRFAGHDSTLREMYANLLATAMDAKTAQQAHPAFVEILKQMTSDEAKIVQLFVSNDSSPLVSIHSVEIPDGNFRIRIKNFSLVGNEAKCVAPERTPEYLDNLHRLRIIAIYEDDRALADNQLYQPLLDHQEVKDVLSQIASEQGKRSEIHKNLFEVTQLGREFIEACVMEHLHE